MAESLLSLRDILVRYGDRTILRLAELDIARGEILALLGPNGAGKSTLLRVMGLLQQPDVGSVSLCGVLAGRGNSLALRRQIAMVFQEPLLINQSVHHNASLGLRLRGVGGAECERRILPWLERLGIASLTHRPAQSLSGGEAQRTSLARAFVLEPQLLLLDEPFSALDPASREALLGDFYRIVRDSRTTTVLVSHDRHECFALADRVAVLQGGHLLQIGTPEEVFFQPANEAVANIVGMENRLRSVVRQRVEEQMVIDINGIEINAAGNFAPGTKVLVCIRSEEISLDCGASGAGWHNHLKGEIREIYPGIENCRVLLNCHRFNLVALIERQQVAEMELAPGVRVGVSFRPRAVHVIEAERD